ncbi:hypothetical protein P43SY_002819 [Pythium insidiosum]|uniref:CWH43-like N-terminal domain-containing protein n=1 Tax=Pythium insidiosum TaxID=114742 RepID=A0AAD5M8V3_PYTIN|nr:hypothetical protein P43SY_002819 [Pythium insidiosum]
MTSPWLSRLRWYAPIISSSTVVITLVTCVILTKTRDIYTGGLDWPYFSDMGRDAPGYYVFCVGLSIVAISLAMTWFFNFQFQRAIMDEPLALGRLSPASLRWARVCCFVGIISVIGLPVLAFFSTSSYPSTHNYGAYYFFFLETFVTLVNTLVSWRIYRALGLNRESTAVMGAPNDKVDRYTSARRTFLIQMVTWGFFFIAFLLYMPIGLSVVQDFTRLTVQECLDRELGQAYCTETMRYDATQTKLWNYENDYAATQMRAAGQLGCIITLVGYSVSFLSHDYARVVDGEARLRVVAPVVATVAVVTTLVTCVILTKANDVYVGGLAWPYFSDMGRDPPGYYVFIVGLSITAVTLAMTWHFNREFQLAVLVNPLEVGQLMSATQGQSTRRWSSVGARLAMLSVIALPILAIFDTSSYPSVHNYSAYAFFLLQTIAVSINTMVSRRIYASSRKVQQPGSSAGSENPAGVSSLSAEEKAQRFHAVRRTYLMQIATYSCFVIAFLLYLPIGLAIIKDFQRLSVSSCLAKDLGKSYCEVEMRYDEDPTLTKLFDYSNDHAANQMRSAAQLVCILTLIGYTVTFTTHEYDRAISEADESMQAAPPITAYVAT